MEKLIENLLKKVSEKESKPEIYDIFSKLRENKFKSKEEIHNFIESFVKLEEN